MSVHFPTIPHPSCSVSITQPLFRAPLHSHPHRVLRFTSGIFLFQTLLSIQMLKELQHVCPPLQISPFRLMLDGSSWKGAQLWPLLNWLLHVFLVPMTNHLLLWRQWKWFIEVNAPTINGQNIYTRTASITLHLHVTSCFSNVKISRQG